jgi:hypothetical protein
MARSIETEFALSVYRKMQLEFIKEYLNDIPEPTDDEDISTTTKRSIKKAITPQINDSAVLAVLRMRIFEEYRTAIGDGNFFALVPDNFQGKMLQFPPQLVVGLGEIMGGGLTKPKWTFAIPHYRYKTPDPKPKIPPLEKGDWWARLILTDNSRVYINAVTAAEGKSFINAIADLIDPEFLPPLPLKIDTGERGGEPIRKVSTKPVSAMYYKKPLKNSKGKFDPRFQPDWIIDLR